MYAGRGICGFAVGLNSMLVPLYIKEVSPVVISGKTGTYNQLFITVGCFVATLFGLLIQDPDEDNQV